MKLTSFGAAEGVTGSKHLIEVNGYRVLLDCGMFQGRRKESDLKNREMPFDPKALDAVLLSHAHIDHSGILPVLSKLGYIGPIYSTCATRDLCSIMLMDSANIQARDAEWLSKKNRSFVAPLYQDLHVHEVMKLFACMPYGKRFEVVPGVSATLRDAGHVLGSAIVTLEFSVNGSAKRLLFTGDLGRRSMPILKDPWEPAETDYLLMESTYGDRDHDPIQTMEGKLAAIIRKTYDRGGKVIIPSFALERAQEVIYALKNLEMEDAIPDIPVYVDSPLTVNITEVFRMYTECFDDEILKLIDSGEDPFQLRQIQYIRKVEDSMRLNGLREPAIIISAAGMCEHGRILHHLKNNCEDPRNTILIVGFQAKNTLGRRIVERERQIKVFGLSYMLNAEVQVLNSFSAHAGKSELTAFAARLKNSAQRTVLVHGEETAIASLRQALETQGLRNITVQEEGVPIEL